MPTEIKIITYEMACSDEDDLRRGEIYLLDRNTYPRTIDSTRWPRWELCRHGRGIIAHILLKSDALKFARMLAKERKKPMPAEIKIVNQTIATNVVDGEVFIADEYKYAFHTMFGYRWNVFQKQNGGALSRGCFRLKRDALKFARLLAKKRKP